MHIRQIKFILALLFLADFLKAQTNKNIADSICESISIYYKDSSIYCKYDTLINIKNLKNDSSIVFAIGNIDLKGISTPYVDIYVSKNLKTYQHVFRDTLLTGDCVPCDSPRDFLGIDIKTHKNARQVIIKCSYFYNRNELAGTIYRSFVYDITFFPLKVIRNFDEEFRHRQTSVCKITGE